MNLFVNVFNANTAEPIVAIFKDGYTAEYTMSIFYLLTTDPAVECIYSNVTGEVLYSA